MSGASGGGVLGPYVAPFLALSVRDLDAMVAWYCDELGFVVHQRVEVPAHDMRAALLTMGRALIELAQVGGARPFAEVAPDVGRRVLAHGIFKAGFVLDPEGNRLQFFGK